MRQEIEDYLNHFGSRPCSFFKRAYAIANAAHATDMRKNGVPYMTHVDEVIDGAWVIAHDLGLSDHSIDQILSIAALHDVVEDHPEDYTLSSIRNMFVADGCFGTALENVIRGVDNITKKPKGEEPYHEYVQRVLSDRWSVITKLSDLTHNMSDLEPGNMLDKYQLTHWVLEQALR